MRTISYTRHPVGRLMLSLLPALAILLLAGPAHAVDAVNQSFLGGVAIKGYDPVAYFTEGKPVEGSDDYEYDWNGATWQFATAENRDKFKADPEKYAPQYGGYCAYAVSLGSTADIDPEAWTIVDGKLYLNLSKSVQSRWEQNRDERIQQADINWPKILAGG